MAYWNVGGMGGRGVGRVGRGRNVDSWDYGQLGKVYDSEIIGRLLPYLRPHRTRVALAIVGMVLAAVANYVQPFVMAKATTALIKNEEVTRFAVLLLVLVFGTWGAQILQRTMMAWVGHRMLFQLRNEVYDHLQELSLSFYDREEVGRVMSRVTSDVTVMQEIVTTGLLNILADVVGLIVIMIAMYLLDAQLALGALAVVPVLVVSMLVWQRFARVAFVRVRQAIAQVNSSINQNVSGMSVVQAMRREDVNLEEFNRLNEENRQSNLLVGRLTAAVMPLVEILSTTATVLVLFLIGLRLFNGSLDPALAAGFALGFTIYIQRFFTPVRELTMQYTALQRAMAGAHRVFEVLDTEPEIADAEDAIELDDVEGRVDFHHVHFAYVEGVAVLRDFDLHVEPGETIALVGHTGAGKTSVTSLINRSYDIQGGSIEIDGIDLRQIQRKSLTRRMSVVLQEPYLFSGTIASNIRYGKLDATQEEIERAATAVGAHDFIVRQPDGYETELNERGRNLSIGQRQLIAFARAVVGEPRILILDEATANVDTQTERVIQGALRELLQNRTSFVIAHRLSTIREADRIVVMRNGEIVEMGDHDELMALDGAYADLYRMTFKAQESQDEIVSVDSGHSD